MADGLRCDVCETFETHRNAGGWMSVQRMSSPRDDYGGSLFYFASGSGRRDTPELHVCSWACLGMLAIQMPETPVDEYA